jgi:hypothetical protein
MISTLQGVVIVAGLCGLGILWAATLAGIIQIAWNSIVDPAKDLMSDKDKR